MIPDFHFSLPLKDPVLIFSIVLLIILLIPLLFEKLKIPGVIGLILAGMVFGPHGLNILQRDSSIILFGTVGLLYIMFLAALEMDLSDFKKNRNKSLTFGLLTFAIPMIVGTLVSIYILKYSLLSSILLASMFASHTLLTYPIVNRMGVAKSRVVNVTVVGTIITDTLALLVLAIIASSTKGTLDTSFWIRLTGSGIVFSIILFWGYPKIGRWFFRNLKSESLYIFVLALVFLAAFLAKIAGMEPIVGAFAAGLALNRLIPQTSPLMNRIHFVGNALFIPFFLIGVGMIVNLKVLLKGSETILVALTMVIVAVSCKWLAAVVSKKLLKFSTTEQNILFGLSNSQAAATLAAVLVGFNLGLFDEAVLNGTVIMILVTCLISSFVTEKAARDLAVTEHQGLPAFTESPQRILIPLANPLVVESLLDFAIMIRHPQLHQPISLITVVQDNDEATIRVAQNKKLFDQAIQHAAATETPVEVLTRVDINVTSGIAMTVKELSATDIIMGWSGQSKTKARIFGTIPDSLLSSTWQTVFVCRLTEPIHVAKRIIALVPPYAEIEYGFTHWLHVLERLSSQSGTKIVCVCSSRTGESIRTALNKNRQGMDVSYRICELWNDIHPLTQGVARDDLILLVSSREGGVSHERSLDDLPAKLAKRFSSQNFVTIYPEQNHGSFQNRMDG